MTKAYLVSEELLRQIMGAWDSETGMKPLCESMDQLRTILAKEPNEPVAWIDEAGNACFAEYVPVQTKLFRKDTP